MPAARASNRIYDIGHITGVVWSCDVDGVGICGVRLGKFDIPWIYLGLHSSKFLSGNEPEHENAKIIMSTGGPQFSSGYDERDSVPTETQSQISCRHRAGMDTPSGISAVAATECLLFLKDTTIETECEKCGLRQTNEKPACCITDPRSYVIRRKAFCNGCGVEARVIEIPVCNTKPWMRSDLAYLKKDQNEYARNTTTG
jgi:hypothetical protein